MGRIRTVVSYEKYAKVRDLNNTNDFKVANATEMPKSTFSEWKNGRSAPKIDKLSRIAKLFGVPIECFLEEIETDDTKESED